ncbi:MAG: hypothetical protein Q9175_005553 [Cornicularia normoerica]
MNTVPYLHTDESSSSPGQDHAAISKEASVPYQAWSSPQQEAQKSRNAPPENSPPSEAQSANGTAALDSSPARLPAFDDGLEWKSLDSAIDDMNSTWPTTPFNDSSLHSSNSYNITPDPAHSDQDTFHYRRNDRTDCSAHAHSDIDGASIGSTLDRPRVCICTSTSVFSLEFDERQAEKGIIPAEI